MDLTSSIKMKIAYYDKGHQTLLENSNNYDPDFIANMKALVADGCEISVSDFVLNSLFHKKQVNSTKYPDRDSLRSSISNTIENMTDYLDIKNNTLVIKKTCDPTVENRERIGESFAISVISKIIGVIDADWDIIPVLPEKAFDFIYSSTGSKVIQIEAKGCFSNENGKSSSISKHKKSIIDKKRSIRNDTNHSYKSDYYYGVITKISNSNEITCYLLDPPTSGFEGNSFKLKIKNRLKYYSQFLNLIAPTSELTKIIINYDNDIYIDNEPLHYKYISDPYNSFFHQKITFQFDNETIGGSLIFQKDNFFIFIGLTSSIIDSIAFGKLASFSKTRTKTLKNIEFHIDGYNLSKSEQEEIEKFIEANPHSSQLLLNQIHFSGDISISNSGVAIGILSLNY